MFNEKMFDEKIISIKKKKEYNNYEEFILDNINYKDHKLFFIPNDLYNSKIYNALNRTLMGISIVKYIQDNFYDNFIYDKYLKDNLLITQCGSTIFILILLCKTKFKFDELFIYIRDSNIFNILVNFCNFIRNNYELNDFYTDNLFIKVIELKNFNISVNYYRDFIDINNLCDYIIYTCNHYFYTNIKNIPLTNYDNSIILDVLLQDIKKSNIIIFCSKKRNNKLFSLFINNDIRYYYNNIFSEKISDLIINMDFNIIDKQYEFCKEKNEYFTDLL